MSAIDRKAAAREFRERAQVRGVFALRSTTSGLVWVGASRHLDAEEGRLRFFLRTGGHRDRLLQEEWSRCDGVGMTFEVLERLADDTPDLVLGDVLKTRTADWAGQLQAPILLP